MHYKIPTTKYRDLKNSVKKKRIEEFWTYPASLRLIKGVFAGSSTCWALFGAERRGIFIFTALMSLFWRLFIICMAIATIFLAIYQNFTNIMYLTETWNNAYWWRFLLVMTKCAFPRTNRMLCLNIYTQLTIQMNLIHMHWFDSHTLIVLVCWSVCVQRIFRSFVCSAIKTHLHRLYRHLKSQTRTEHHHFLNGILNR